HVPRVAGERPGRGVRKHDGSARGVERVRHRGVVHVGEIHQNPESIHFVYHVPAERREAAPRSVGGGGGPRETPPVGERDITNAERCEHPQRAERVLDGVPALDADQARDLSRFEVPLDVGRGAGRGEIARVLRAQPLDQVDLLERIHGRVWPGIDRRDGHVGRPELRPDPARAEFRDVAHELRLEHGEIHGVEAAFAPHKTLLEVLREDLGLTGTKHGCELGECGTCTVLLDGTPVLSCLVLGLACAGNRVKTVEGMAERGTLHPLQEAFAELGAAQCGYCTPAFLLAAEALLATDPSPTRDDIKLALSGNLCRCTGYIKIYEAVELAAARMRGEDAKPAPETLYGVQ